VTRLGKIPPFGLLFKGPGNFGEKTVAQKSGSISLMAHEQIAHF